MRGRRTSTGVLTAAVLTAALLGPLSLAGCSPDAAERKERADRHLAEGQTQEALLELRSALQIEPNDAQTNFRIAEIAQDLGKLEDAVFFYRETLRIDSTRSDAALAEARLIAWEDPERAGELIAGVLEREPSHTLARVRLSEFELIREDVPAALVAALTAVELAPDDYRTHVQLGIVRRAQVRELRIVGDAPPDALFEQALAAFDRALELSGPAPPDEILQVRLERAIVFAGWGGHRSEAVAAYREAVESTEGPGQQAALVAAIRYARNVGDAELRRWGLERQLALDPEAYAAWGELARLEDESGRSGNAVLESLLELRPKAAQAHVLYARYLAGAGQPDQAAAHLLDVADQADDPASVLALAVAMKLRAGEPGAAREVLVRLEAGYPDLPATEFARAQEAFVSGRLDAAVGILEGLTERAPSRRVSELLARAELRREVLPAALIAVDRALELSGSGPAPAELLRLKARIQVAVRDWPAARRTLQRLSRRSDTGLRPGDQILLARTLYGLGRPGAGKQALERLLVSTEPPLEALIEYGRRERRRDPERSRVLLEQAVERAPNDLRGLALLVRLDLETGNPEAARARTDAAIERSPSSARLHLLRARLLAAEGNLEAALGDTRRALELRPDLAGASQLQVALLSEQGELEQAIESLEALAAEGHLDPPGRVRLARMHSALGNDDRSIELLEQALGEQSDLHTGKNDLAFLLTRSGVDLDRAVQLAQDARSALPDSPDVADTLGYAYLRKGLPQAALQQLEAAVELAEARGRADPVILYHLALALEALGRGGEAATVLEDSLAIEGDFPGFPREEARRELQTLRTAEAAEGNSS
jgi:tetratricopeptide (TPR) repeat protein